MTVDDQPMRPLVCRFCGAEGPGVFIRTLWEGGRWVTVEECHWIPGCQRRQKEREVDRGVG